MIGLRGTELHQGRRGRTTAPSRLRARVRGSEGKAVPLSLASLDLGVFRPPREGTALPSEPPVEFLLGGAGTTPSAPDVAMAAARPTVKDYQRGAVKTWSAGAVKLCHGPYHLRVCLVDAINSRYFGTRNIKKLYHT